MSSRAISPQFRLLNEMRLKRLVVYESRGIYGAF